MLHHNRRSVYSQLQPNISLQESPIRAPYLHDADHSPEQYFYPTSLELKHPKVARQLDLKVTITNLLSQLKEWLIQLCLTQHCMSEVNQQLQPIIEQMIDNAEQEEESYWIDHNYYNRNIHQRSLNESDNIVINSAVSEEVKQCSVLTIDSKTEVALITEAEKKLVQMFFKRYYRLFENCLNRIKRFSGQKKLKFLVDTTVRNIFSQTLRVSYDLKLIEHKILQQKKLKAAYNRNGYINVLVERITMILQDRGNIRTSFKCMKTQYAEQSKKDREFVGAMMKKINKLCGLYEKNKRWAITHHLYSWRQRSLELKIAQQQALIKLVQTSISDILPSLAPTPNVDDFRYNWRNAIETQLNLLIDTLFTGEDCLFISIQHIMQANRIERNASLVQLLEQQEQLCVTHRTHPWKQHPFLNEFTIEELKNCLITGEIFKCDRNNSSLLLVPIKPASGIIFASLSNQNHSSLSFSKSPMNLRSFRILLRLVELISPLLLDLTDICKKLELQWQQIDRNSHYQMLFKQFVKSELLEYRENGHLQVAERGQQGLQIDSHRLQSPNTVISTVMDKLSISSLMIYHNLQPQLIRELPCVVIGDNDVSRTQKHIIQSIYTELLSSGKEIMTITRNAITFTILPLKKNGQVIGLIHCIGYKDSILDYKVVCECLVPLIMKHEGAMQCQECQIKVKVPQEQTITQLKVVQQRRLPFKDAADLVITENIYQLQDKLKRLLQRQGNFFQKMIFRVDLSDPSFYFYFDQSRQSCLLTLSNSQQITHADIFIEQNYNLAAANPLAKLVHKYPCFNNPQIHIYEVEVTHTFRIIGIPIKNDKHMFGYWIIGHYLRDQTRQNQGIIQWAKNIGKSLGMNSLFMANRIDSQDLIKQLMTRSEIEDQRQQQIIKKITECKCQGKIFEQFQKINQVINSINPSLRATVLKLNSDEQLRIAYTCRQGSPSLISMTLTHEMSESLKGITIISSHQKILSQSCKLSKKSEFRTIRPMKSDKLHNSFIFLPEIKRQGKIKLITHIKQKYQLEGWISTDYLCLLEEIQSQLWVEEQRQQYLNLLINLGNRHNQTYYFIISMPFQDNQMINYLSDNILAHIQYQLKNITALSNTPTNKTKANAIKQLSHIIRENLTKKHCVNQFKLYLQHSKAKINQLISVVSHILSPQKSKQRRYFDWLENGFNHIQQQSKSIRDRYSRFGLMTSGIMQKALNRCQYILGFDSIYTSIAQPLPFNSIRSCNQLYDSLQKLKIKNIRPIFQLLKTYSHYIYKNNRISKLISIQKITHLISMSLHKLKMHFFFQISKLSASFETNLNLISQQFQKLSFRSRQQFLKFSNQRFQTIFNHYEFGLILKIQLMCGLSLGARKLVYKIGGQRQIQEFIGSGGDDDRKVGIFWMQVQTKVRRAGHYLILKITTKNNCKATKQTNTILQSIQKSLVPCYSNYLTEVQSKTDKLCSLILKITCKEMWNGSCSQPQKIYAFHPDKCIQYQCLKLKFINTLKSIKQTQQINQIKFISAAINQQSKMNYNLEYQYNAISAILAGKTTHQAEQLQIVEKYGKIVTRQQLMKLREQLQLLEAQQQKKMLHYQIKSKTFATSHIITFLQKRKNNSLEKTTYRYLCNSNKENERNTSNLSNIEKAYVDQKIELAEIKKDINEVKKKEKKMATRSMWLILSRVLRKQKQRDMCLVFETLLMPKQKHTRIPL